MKMRYPFLAMVLSISVSLSALHAEGRAKAPPIPDADHAAMQNYRITDDVAQRLLAVSADARKARLDKAWMFAQLYSSSLDDITDRVLTTQPRLARIVESHGFGRREYMTAIYALASARQATLYGPDEASGAVVHDQFVSSKNASEANIAYYKAHAAMVDPLMEGGPVTQDGTKRPPGRCCI
ncbi:hypothetical protein [Luteibacter sp. Lutesp34]|uniref:hypothetical protein n=1 Tax=Luteibacter sp. Lutesp34 TaxID=3243030 RepID=UPI0039B3AAD0